MNVAVGKKSFGGLDAWRAGSGHSVTLLTSSDEFVVKPGSSNSGSESIIAFSSSATRIKIKP